MSNGQERGKDYTFEGDVDILNPAKFAFRREALARDRRRTKMLELYAGVGYLTAAVYAGAYREVVVVEKDPEHFRRLMKRLGRFANVRYYNKVNAAFIAEDLGDHLDFSAVDFDAFGAPGETAAAFFGALEGKAAEPFLLLMTDCWRRGAARR
jgi:hypothetical protein